MRINFSVRVLLFSLALIVATAALSAFVSYYQTKQRLEQILGEELLAIVNSAAFFIDGDIHDLLYINQDGSFDYEDEYNLIQSQLIAIEARNNLSHQEGSPVYSLRQAPDFAETSELEFVVMSKEETSGELLLGNRYPIKPHLVKAFNGEAAATGVYSDDEGTWISAASPIRNADGSIVGVLQADRHVEYFYTQAQEEAGLIFIGASASVLISGLLAILFSRSIVSPIRELTDFTRVFGEGQRKKRVLLERNDEIGDLGRAINWMAEQVEIQTAEIIAEREKAEQASRAKSDFLANMSHEVRTPINAIISLTQLLSYSELNEEQEADVKTIDSCANSLRGLINDILDFSKIESGKLYIDNEEFDLLHCVQKTIRQLESPAKDKNIEIVFHHGPDVPPKIVGDAIRLEQVLRNLIGNAVKFTPNGGGILVFVKLEEASSEEIKIHFAVSDSGIGIAKEKQQSIFKAFTQAEAATTKHFGGTGLGLSISEKLVDKMGGKIWVESKPGVGSCFHFTLNSKRLSKPEQEVIVPETEEERRTANQGKLILVVEDNEINQDTIYRLLSHEGYSVSIAESGSKALELTAADSFDLILMDLHMPEMNGIEATKLIRSNSGPCSKVPIIGLTADAVKGTKEKCLEAGMNNYLTKPIDYALLLSTITETFQKTSS